MESLRTSYSDEVRSQNFTYKPLTTADSIRLLVLQPGTPGLSIHCSLIHTTLAECHDDIYDHYTALSYTWGDPKEVKTIFIDGHSVSITANLAAALDGLRDKWRLLRLWADAICINQSNIQERNHQVGLMRDIYALAQQTVVYLGYSNKHYERLLHAIHDSELSNQLRQLAITQILSQPWFTRVWIYQELVLAKEVWVQWGGIRVKWDKFCSALLGSQNSRNLGSSKSHKLDESTDLLANMQKARQKFRTSLLTNSKPESLLSVLLARRGFGVTDLRDLVYGNIAVAGLHQRPGGFEVDYEKNVIEVFKDATCHIIESHGWRVLLHCELKDAQRRMKNLPSWIPDWSLESSCFIPPLPYIHGRFLPNCCKQTASKAEGSPSSATILLRERKLAEIQDTTTIIPAPFDPTIREYIEEVVELNSSFESQELRYRLNTLREKIYEYWTHQQLEGSGIFGDILTNSIKIFRHSECLELLCDAFGVDPDTRIRPRKQNRKQNRKTLTRYLMNHFIRSHELSVLTGRRIASLSQGDLAIVPAEARRGDIVYFLPIEDCIHLVILRPYIRLVSQKEQEKMALQLFATSEIEFADKTQYFTLIGTAWTESGCKILHNPVDIKFQIDGHNVALC